MEFPKRYLDSGNAFLMPHPINKNDQDHISYQNHCLKTEDC